MHSGYLHTEFSQDHAASLHPLDAQKSGSNHLQFIFPPEYTLIPDSKFAEWGNVLGIFICSRNGIIHKLVFDLTETETLGVFLSDAYQGLVSTECQLGQERAICFELVHSEHRDNESVAIGDSLNRLHVIKLSSILNTMLTIKVYIYIYIHQYIE